MRPSMRRHFLPVTKVYNKIDAINIVFVIYRWNIVLRSKKGWIG